MIAIFFDHSFATSSTLMLTQAVERFHLYVLLNVYNINLYSLPASASPRPRSIENIIYIRQVPSIWNLFVLGTPPILISISPSTLNNRDWLWKKILHNLSCPILVAPRKCTTLKSNFILPCGRVGPSFNVCEISEDWSLIFMKPPMTIKWPSSEWYTTINDYSTTIYAQIVTFRGLGLAIGTGRRTHFI